MGQGFLKTYIGPYQGHNATSRRYYAMRGFPDGRELEMPAELPGEGDDPGGARGYSSVAFIPNDGEWITYLRPEHISSTKEEMNGSEVIFYFHPRDYRQRPIGEPITVTVRGRNLHNLSEAVMENHCYSVEAFDPAKHDRPDDGEGPFIDSIAFTDAKARQRRRVSADIIPLPDKPKPF